MNGLKINSIRRIRFYKHIKNFLLYITFLSGYFLELNAKADYLPPLQNTTISGQVLDAETNEALPGVTVQIKGTSSGAITDVNGNYTLADVSESSILVFSYIGYQTIEIVVGTQTVVNVRLETDVESLQEVVVVGYGTQLKREVTGAVSKISSKDFNPTLNTNVEQMLEGKLAGVQVVQNSGEPGGGMSINIRGEGSINAGTGPLYVIDGLPINNSTVIGGTGNEIAATRTPRNPISFLNPADIESIEVLKDASAAAIYGARGANGVVLITTRSGTSGKIKVDYSGQFGINTVHNRLDLLNAQQYFDGINQIIEDGVEGDWQPVEAFEGNGTDWQDIVFQDAIVQSHNISVSGGNETTSFLISSNYNSEEGLIRNTSFDRYTLRLNLDHTTDKFRVGVNVTTSYIQDNFVPNGFDVNLRGGAINAARQWDPTFPVRNPDGSFFTTDLYDIDNPEAIITGNHINGNRYRTLGTTYAEYFILPQLSAMIRLGADVLSEDKTAYKDRTTVIGGSLNGVATAFQANRSNYLFEGTLNYNQDFGKHAINGVLGVTTQRFTNSSSSQEGTNFTTDATLADNFALADPTTLQNTSSKNQNQLLSYLGRVNYKYLERYLLTASYRIDGSSRFGEGNRFGFFPSVSVGWLLDQESFIPQTDVLTTLKLRASWGQTGNDRIGNYEYLPTFRGGANRTSYVLDDQLAIAFNPQRIPNPDLQWETTTQIDIGLDFALFNNRVSGSIEWYKKNTTDMLLNLAVPRETGFASIRTNAGEIQNSGIEFYINTINYDRNGFRWSSDANFYTLENEVVSLAGTDSLISESFAISNGNFALTAEGQPLRSFFGYEVIGIWQENDDFDAISNDVQPGDFKFRDINGDGIIDSDDRTIIGNSFPDFSWGFGNTFSYKGFSLYVFLRGVHGVDMLNANLMEQYFPTRAGARVNRFADPFLNRWTPDNPTNEQPSYLGISRQAAQSVNSRTVVDASFVKIQNVRIGYQIPDKILPDFFRSFEVYVSGVNLATFTDYDGFDPALNSDGSSNFRIDWNTYPSATSFILGLNVGF